MKRLSFLSLLLLPVAIFSQVTEYSAKRIKANDSLFVNGKWVKKITTNLNSPDSNSQDMFPTNRAVMDMIRSGGGGVPATSNFLSDIGRLMEVKTYAPAQGVASSRAVVNYSHTSVDSTYYNFSSVRAGTAGTEYGGWRFPAASGDSIRVTAPFWVVFGDSQAEGHPDRHGRLHPLVNGVTQSIYQWDYPDSVGQLSYHFRQATNMRFYNHGIGGQTSVQCRVRFARDVLGLVSPGMTDGRGTQTLSRRPNGVIIIVGINDIFNGVPLETLKANLFYFAATCKEYGIPCVIFNLPGDAISGQAELIKIATINKWLADGALSSTGAYVYDYNKWWNKFDPPNNFVPQPLVKDDIHPSMAGYADLAADAVQAAKIPVLSRAVFINQVDATNPVGYARPVNITINGVAYSLNSGNDTIDINSFVPDSAWIKVISSTPVTSPDTSGFSHIEWFQDNNPEDSTYFTRRTPYSSGSNSLLNVSKITLIPQTGATTSILDAYLFDNVNHALQVNTNQGSTEMVVNGLNQTATINNATVSIYRAGGNALSTNGSITASGGGSQFGNVQIGNTTTPGTTGFGIGVIGNAMQFHMGGNTNLNNSGYIFSKFGTTTPNTSFPNVKFGGVHINFGWGNSGDNDTLVTVLLTPPYNDTTVSTGIPGFTGGWMFDPNVISTGNNRFFHIWNTRGNNWFNTAAGSTVVGSNRVTSRKFFVDGSMGIHPDSLPTVGTITTERIMLLDPATSQVKAFTGSLTATTIYNGNGTLSGLRQVSGAGNSLHLGTSGSKLNQLVVNAADDAIINSDDQIRLNGGLVLKGSVATDADFTVTDNMAHVFLPAITADRTLTLNPILAPVQTLFIYNGNTSTNSWNINTGVANIHDAASNALPRLNNQTYYVIQATNGGSGEWQVVSKYGPDRIVTSAATSLSMEIFTDVYVATGTSQTFTLPTSTFFNGNARITVKNRGTNALTVAAGGSDQIWDTSAGASVSLAVGEARTFIWDGSFWELK